jgi:outer membrane protein OmpA-like peptidoglycan-associated protein
MQRYFSSIVKVAASALLVLNAGAQKTAPAPAIPLCPGLTIVTAVNGSVGDYESIKTVESVDAKEVRLKYSSEVNDADWLGTGAQVKNLVLHRTTLIPDLQTANVYQQVYLEKSAETIPGTTAIGTSSAVLRGLKTKGEADLSISNAYAGLELSADRSKFPNYYQYLQGGKIQKVGTSRMSVLVNDKPTELPAIQATGDLVGNKVEFFFLDDGRNPLALAFRIDIEGFKPLTAEQRQLCDTMEKAAKEASNKQTGFHADPNVLMASLGGNIRCNLPNGGPKNVLRVIKINSRCAGPAAMLPGSPGGSGQMPNGSASGAGDSEGAKALEQALSQDKKVDIYSIYFSFNSDKLREESQPTLKDIAEVMRRHPDWKLQVNGHTDGIGGDQSNLDLSKRRAAAVKDALEKQYKIATGRLATAGYGKSQPKDTNDTLEGRARNRRVELMKIS